MTIAFATAGEQQTPAPRPMKDALYESLELVDRTLDRIQHMMDVHTGSIVPEDVRYWPETTHGMILELYRRLVVLHDVARTLEHKATLVGEKPSPPQAVAAAETRGR